MKKRLLIFLFVLLFITGCNKMNTPTNEVQKLFLNYTTLTSDVLFQLDSVLKTEDITDSQKEKYKEILKKQYEDLKYNVTNEVISNDNAVVSVEIEVYNLGKAIDEASKYLENHKDEFYSNDEFSKEKYWNYKLENMFNMKERTKYNLELTLTKIDNKWHLDDLLESDRQKIHGLYKNEI